MLRRIREWIHHSRELRTLVPRIAELELELSETLNTPVRLQPAAAKSGFDVICFAVNSEDVPLAVVRLNKSCRPYKQCLKTYHLRQRLSAANRLRHEWDTYQILSPYGLSPRPLWRTQDAVACAWLSWPTAGAVLKEYPECCWDVLERVLPRLEAMHRLGVIHLDPHLGNILLEPDSEQVAFIDFELAAVEGLSEESLKLFDYLLLINDAARLRRGGEYLLQDLPRLISLLEATVPTDVKTADGPSLPLLENLSRQPEFLEALQQVFPQIDGAVATAMPHRYCV